MMPIFSSNKVAVILVIFNDAAWLRACLDSVSASNLPLDIVVVDNASSDDSVAILKERADLHLVENTENVGFAAGVNQAARYVMELLGGAQYMFVLNPDTRVEPTAILQLMKFMDENPGYGVVGPLQLVYSDSRRPSTLHLNSWTSNMLASESIDYIDRHLRRQPREVARWEGSAFRCSYVQGAAMFCAVNFFFELGGFDETYWMFHEEVDFCRRAWWASRPVALVGTAFIEHAHRDTHSGERVRTYFRTRNRYYYVLTEPSVGLQGAFRVCGRILLQDVQTIVEARVGRFSRARGLARSVCWIVGHFFLLIKKRRQRTRAYRIGI